MHNLILGATLPVGICLYFLPTILAVTRIRQRRAAVFLVNLLFGWTVIGWIAAMLSIAEQRKLDQDLVTSERKEKGTWSFDRSSDGRREQNDDWVLT